MLKVHIIMISISVLSGNAIIENDNNKAFNSNTVIAMNSA